MELFHHLSDGTDGVAQISVALDPGSRDDRGVLRADEALVHQRADILVDGINAHVYRLAYTVV